MTEFKQIIGRGTRVRSDYGKLYFSILDYTGSATRLFADSAFDGEPALLTEEEINELGEVKEDSEEIIKPEDEKEYEEASEELLADSSIISEPDIAENEKRKYYVDDGEKVKIVYDYEQTLDEDGNKLCVVKYTDYTAEKVRAMFPSAASLLSKWQVADERATIIESLEEKGISFDELVHATRQVDCDHFDLLCHIAFNAPLRSRRERAERLRKGKMDFFEYFSPEAQKVLNEILDKYIDFGIEQFKVPDILKVEPISSHGNVMEIAEFFNGPDKLKNALEKMQIMLYE